MTLFKQVVFPNPGMITVSPDGRFFAVLEQSHKELAIFNVTTSQIAKVPSPTGRPMGPDAALSPDGKWLAATHLTPTGSDSILVLERHGSVGRAVVNGPVRLLGWLANMIIYTDDVNLYAIAPAGDPPLRLAAVPFGVQLAEPEFGPSTSPDGQVMLVRKNHQGYLGLVNNAIVALPLSVVTGRSTVYWVGGHEALGMSATGQILSVDLATQKVTKQAPARVPPESAYIEALSGPWLEWASLSDNHAHVTNVTTGTDEDLGLKPEPGVVLSMNDGRFLLAASNGDAFLFSPH